MGEAMNIPYITSVVLLLVYGEEDLYREYEEATSYRVLRLRR